MRAVQLSAEFCEFQKCFPMFYNIINYVDNMNIEPGTVRR